MGDCEQFLDAIKASCNGEKLAVDDYHAKAFADPYPNPTRCYVQFPLDRLGPADEGESVEVHGSRNLECVFKALQCLECIYKALECTDPTLPRVRTCVSVSSLLWLIYRLCVTQLTSRRNMFPWKDLARRVDAGL